jgi:hypothetical protein
MTPQQSLLLLIAQLAQLAVSEVPNIIQLIATLRDGTKTMEQFLTEADKIELAEIEKLKGQITP